MKNIFIIKTGSTFKATAAREGDFEEMTRRGLGPCGDRVRIIDAAGGEALPLPKACGGVVITGAHCMVTDNLPWSLAIERWLPSLIQAGVPLLGICYGHQLLGRAMGGLVDYHPGGEEIGTVSISRTPASRTDRIFARLPEQFHVHATHAQTVLTLPPGAVLLAGNAFEPHHAFRLGDSAWGVQFHPEYSGATMKDYLLAQVDSLALTGQDINSVLEEVRETPAASSILSTFAELALKRATS